MSLSVDTELRRRNGCSKKIFNPENFKASPASEKGCKKSGAA
jgi:hypothetical protein